MSSTDVKMETQVKGHNGPLIGLVAGGVFVVIILVVMLSNVLDGEVENRVEPVETLVIPSPSG